MLERPPGHLSGLVPDPGPGLARFPAAQLASELLRRVREDANASAVHGRFADPVFALLVDALDLAADVHDNRFSRANVWNHMWWLDSHLPGGLASVRGKSVLELGCGGLNPLARLFTLLMAGARRGVGIDADQFVDPASACRALARCASHAVLDPASIFGGRVIPAAEVAQNLAGFDLKQLRLGDSRGLDPTRLVFRQGVAERLELADRSVDLVMSFAFLEHVADPDVVLAEMARVMAPGGFGVHIIDGTDHDSHGRPELHPLGFLRDRSRARLVHGSNRLRPLRFRPVFERHGLEWVSSDVHLRLPVDAALRASLAEPFASLPQEDLEVASLLVTVRRRASTPASPPDERRRPEALPGASLGAEG